MQNWIMQSFLRTVCHLISQWHVSLELHLVFCAVRLLCAFQILMGAINAIQYNTIQYKTCNAPYVTRKLFVGSGMTRD